VSAATSAASRLRPRDLLAVGTVGMRTRKVRALLTTSGVAIGIAAIVAVLGISASSKADLLAQLDALGTNLLTVTPGQSFLGADSTLPTAAAAMIRRITPVQSAAGITAVSSATVRRSNRIPPEETGGITVYATEPQLASTLQARMRAGRFLNRATARLPAVVLGAKAAERLGIASLDGSPLVWLGDHWYAVVGILESNQLTPELDSAALIGYQQAAHDFKTSRSASTIYVRTEPSRVDAVRSVLPATANPQSPHEVQVTRPSDALAAKAATDRALTALLVSLGGVALLVGGVGIANVMVISVLERRTEIGVRRALGATRRHVRLQFLFEAALLALAGGVIGVVLGAVVTGSYAVFRGWTVRVPLAGLAGGVAAALVIGAVAGLYPAARAARLAPAEAVRAP
jgi:putative ABC transport system permease protein